MLMATDSTHLHQAKGRAMAEKIGVFVSHHHSPEEDAFTARLVADLEAAGADVWVDTSGIMSDDFVKKISEGLAGRQWLVLVMTPAAVTSPWVQREVNAAINEHTAGRMLGVLPFVMQPCPEDKIPILWRPLYRYDATKEYPIARDRLLSAVGLSLPTVKDAPQSPRQDAKDHQQDEDEISTLPRQPDRARGLDVARLKTLDGLLSLSPREFEDAVALMLTANGFRSVLQTPRNAFVDIICTSPEGRVTGVVCKGFRPGNLVGVGGIASAVGASQADHSILTMIVTTTGYTPEALSFASNNRDYVRLLDGQQLVEMMQRVQPQ
jgi:hypothetical protein